MGQMPADALGACGTAAAPQPAIGTKRRLPARAEHRHAALERPGCDPPLQELLGSGAIHSPVVLRAAKAEIQQLIKFVAINYLAVVKAIKKRNRHLQARCKPAGA
jgi:hypothetical protein